MFIVSLHGTKPEQFCAVAGGLLHYFMLVTFFLMAAEAINLYLKLVIVLGIPEFLKNKYVLKVSIIAWSKLHAWSGQCLLDLNHEIHDCGVFLFPVVPLIIVIVSEAPNWRNYVRGTL